MMVSQIAPSVMAIPSPKFPSERHRQDHAHQSDYYHIDEYVKHHDPEPEQHMNPCADLVYRGVTVNKVLIKHAE